MIRPTKNHSSDLIVFILMEKILVYNIETGKSVREQEEIERGLFFIIKRFSL